jgi:Animal haem peroxidase
MANNDKENDTSEIKEPSSSVNTTDPNITVPPGDLPVEVRASERTLNESKKRFHGAKINLKWFPREMTDSPCADKFGYMSSDTTRRASRLEFNQTNIDLLEQLGGMMGDPDRDQGDDSAIPAGYTYFGQFVDHDITLDVSSKIEETQDPSSITNMRSPTLDLDNVYGRGPAVNPYLYDFPAGGTAIKMKLGKNKLPPPDIQPQSGGPSTDGGGVDGMAIKTDFDVPRIEGTNTAVIGDPRNDENLIVAQFQHAMLRFHNAVVDIVAAEASVEDIFVESKRRVTHHYQWALVHDFLKRVCGSEAVENALGSVAASVGSPFSMPVEFSVAAYRFGHSLIRNRYWLNHGLRNKPLSDVFKFIRNPLLPVLTNWVVDFNAFFETGIPVPVFNNTRKIDSVLANGLEDIPGGSGIMAILAARNLRRGLAFGLPSGQAMARSVGFDPLNADQLVQGLPQDEIDILNAEDRRLLRKTPLWYYILREAAVQNAGEHLGDLGGYIVARTFIKMLKRDGDSYLNVTGGFTPSLPSDTAGDFTVTDIIKLGGVNIP